MYEVYKKRVDGDWGDYEFVATAETKSGAAALIAQVLLDEEGVQFFSIIPRHETTPALGPE